MGYDEYLSQELDRDLNEREAFLDWFESHEDSLLERWREIECDEEVDKAKFMEFAKGIYEDDQGPYDGDPDSLEWVY